MSSWPGSAPSLTWPPRPQIPGTTRSRREPMPAATTCESCGMPIETGRYCDYCTDETGALQSFDERFERMTAWQAGRNTGASRQEIERQTLDYMATMPAWRDHPRVTTGRQGPVW